MQKLKYLGSVALLVAAIVAGVFGLMPAGAKAIGEPPAGTANSVQSYTLYPSEVITVDGTIYSDAQNLAYWNAAEIFITADVASGALITVTAQVSADGTNFADADYEWGDSDSVNTQAYVRVLSADGTEYMRLPMAGEWLRVSIGTYGTVTPTIMATMRNN